MLPNTKKLTLTIVGCFYNISLSLIKMSQVLPILPIAVGQDVRLNFFKPQIWNSTEFVKELYNAAKKIDSAL